MPKYSGQEVILRGFVGTDVEAKFTPSGKKISHFTVATGGASKGADDKEKDKYPTVWYRCQVWEDEDSLLEELVKKGAYVKVQGPLTFQKYKGNLQLTVTITRLSGEGASEGEWVLLGVVPPKGKLARPGANGGNGHKADEPVLEAELVEA